MGDLGELVYNAYAESIRSGTSTRDGWIYDGWSAPPWAELTERERDAWRAAAAAIISHYEERSA